jgi:hypothetical protein
VTDHITLQFKCKIQSSISRYEENLRYLTEDPNDLQEVNQLVSERLCNEKLRHFNRPVVASVR